MRSASQVIARRISQSHHVKNHFPQLRPLSTATRPNTITDKDQTPPKLSNKDSLILEKFRQRKLQGSSSSSSKTAFQEAPSVTRRSEEDGGGGGNAKVVSSFEELGLKKELIESGKEIGIFVPSEIQCVGIPAILQGKSVILSSDSGSGRTLAFFLPLLQLLRRDEAISSAKAKHPRAIVLCSTEELADEGFRMAKFISDFVRSTSAHVAKSRQLVPEDVSDSQMGLLIGTPDEIVQQMEDGSIVTDDIKYMVLDDADTMFDLGFGSDIIKIVKPLKNRVLKMHNQGFQTVFVASSMTKVLRKEFSPIVESLEKLNKGKVTAMMLEMDQTDVFDILESPDVLYRKMADAVKSLTSGP